MTDDTLNPGRPQILSSKRGVCLLDFLVSFSHPWPKGCFLDLGGCGVWCQDRAEWWGRKTHLGIYVPFLLLSWTWMQVALSRKLLAISKLGAFLLFMMLVWGGTSQGQGHHRFSLI